MYRMMTQPGGGGTGVGNPGFIDFTLITPPGGGSVVVPMRRIISGSLEGNFQVNFKQLMPRDAVASGGAPVSVTHGIGATGFFATDDLNFDAQKVMLQTGDSIINSNGILLMEQKATSWYPWLTKEYLRSKGHDVRLVNMGVSSSFSPGHDKFRLAGKYDLERIDWWFDSTGANDNGATTPAAFRAFKDAQIAYKQQYYPACKLVLQGPTPLENNASETLLEALRVQMQAAVVAANDPNVLYCNLAGTGTIDRTAGTLHYVTTDGAGVRVHLNAVGLKKIYTDVVKPFLDANPSVWN
jgi:hypothetical protein